MSTPEPARAKVLFVDDEPRILLTLKTLFRGTYEVLTAVGGQVALELMKQHRFDVIVSDQRMPVMLGVEVLARARELQPRAIRMLLTGYSDLNAIVGSINEGEIFRFISKPWSNDDLRATMADAVRASHAAQIVVPRAVAPAGRSETAAAPASADGAGTDAAASDVGVMILDHDPEERAALRNVLGLQWPIYTAASPEECVGLLERHRIGVIITEMVVAGEPVVALLAALRQHQPGLVTIVITAQADAGHALKLINHGQIYRLLQKPVKDSLVRGNVNMAVRRFETLEQNPEMMQRVSAQAPPPSAELEKTGLLSRIRGLLKRA